MTLVRYLKREKKGKIKRKNKRKLENILTNSEARYEKNIFILPLNKLVLNISHVVKEL